jgi:hypothetical protein
MLLTLLECALGGWMVAITLRDLFDTVVVPGRVRGTLKLSRRYVNLGLALWTGLARRRVGIHFAPIVLLASFVTWMLLLVIGFALLAHGLRESFSPPLAGFGEALYVAGSALTTIGLGDSAAFGAGAAVLVAAGFCGLAAMTMAVTYLLEVQSNIALRDIGVLKIATSAGQPPSALGLLERYAALGCGEELADVMRDGRDWCAAVLQSHATHPWLIYFRSAGTGAGWPATLGALVDLALIVEVVVDAPQARGAAVLLREQAARLARDLALLLNLECAPALVTAAQLEALRARLRDSGYALREGIAVAAYLSLRAEEVGWVDALAAHLALPTSPLLPAA